MPLLLRAAVAEDRGTGAAPAATRSPACGRQASMTRVTTPAGHRTRPHVHDAEQLTYLISGDLWTFVIDSGGRGHAFHMRAGDFGRIPMLAVHWSWNRSSSPCELIECHMPGLLQEAAGAPGARSLLAPWERPAASAPSAPAQTFFVDPAHHPVAETERGCDGAESRTGLFMHGADIAASVADERSLARGLSNKMVYGRAGSLMVATRQGGYHTNPHVHECEQLNFVTRGRLCAFVLEPGGDGHALTASAGDFWRVPGYAVHWIRSNPADGPFEMVELHCPGLQADAGANARAVPLFADGEDRSTTGSPSNVFLDPAAYPVREVEALAGFNNA
jgi:oxalate decarboxylase/phosphoglucose isomerase-like protein (cupin superfamily)